MESTPKQGTGSGVIIDGEGFIVTNNHVVDFADEITVTLYDQRKFKATKVGTDPTTDLALIKIEAEELPVLAYGNSDDVKVGEWVLAVGNPFNLTSTVTAGIVSAKGRNIDILEGRTAIESFIQTDAAVNPGNSGGALVDQQGNLIGINTAIASYTGSFSGYSFAVPASIVMKVVEDLKEFGTAQRGFMGVSIQSMDSELATELGVNIVEGVHIAGIEDGGAADDAGMKVDDIVTQINGRNVKTAPELQELVGRNRPGDEVEVTVNRKGALKKLYITLRGNDD
jgi:S1-C subfamily serine protease